MSVNNEIRITDSNIINILMEIEHIVDTKSKHGICFVGTDVEYIQKIIDCIIFYQRDKVYDISYFKDKHYTCDDENSEFRYIRFRVTSKYDYTHQEAKEDMEYWTRKEDLGHILFIIIPYSPYYYFELRGEEIQQFKEKFYMVRVDSPE